MLTHAQKVERISKWLKERKSKEPISLHKKSVSHEVPKAHDKKYSDEHLDVSGLNNILEINPAKKICIAEPGVTFVGLVKETLKHNLVPIVVPELKTITIGGAVAGCSIESMSFVHGGFHDTCLEYEVVTAKGEVLVCTPGNKNKLVFQMMHGTFGTLGIITRLKFKLIPAKKFVKVTYEKYRNLEDYKKAIWGHFEKKDIDFMDGMIHSPTEYVLSVGNFTATAPYSHSYDWMRVYYRSTKTRREDYLKTADYFFRYDKGVTNVKPRSFVGRLLIGWFFSSAELLRMAQDLRWLLPLIKIPITLDVFIPFSKVSRFMGWYKKEIKFYPIWVVPYKRVHNYEWLSGEYLKKTKDKLFLDLAIYGMKQESGKNYYRIIEEELLKVGGLKTLISSNYFSEKEFWSIWNRKNYYKVKVKTDPDNILRDLYAKTCKAARGIGK